MENDRIKKSRSPDGYTTWYLDNRLILQLDKQGTVTAFQADSRAARYLINKLLDPTRYRVYNNLLIEYRGGEVVSVLSPMEVLLRWRKQKS